MSSTLRYSQYWAALTALLLLLHAGAGTVVVADTVGALRRHGGQQGIAGGNGRQSVVPYQLLQFTVPGVPVGSLVPGVCADLVEGDGAVVEVQRGRRGHVRRRVVLVQVGGAVAEDGLLLDGSRHQIRRADRRGRHCKAMSAGLDLQLLNDETRFSG